MSRGLCEDCIHANVCAWYNNLFDEDIVLPEPSMEVQVTKCEFFKK